MIFSGYKGKTVAGPSIDGIQCPSCENKEFVSFGLMRYYHIYWVPCFITSKSAGIECTHCKKTLLDNELTADLSKEIKGKVFNKKNTIPMFIGSFIVMIFAAIIAFSVNHMIKQEAEYFANPAVNDMYVVDFSQIFPDEIDEDDDIKYGVLRIKEITPEQIEFQVSQFIYNKKSGVRDAISDREASKDSYYDSEPLYFDTSELKSMKDDNTISSIERRN